MTRDEHRAEALRLLDSAVPYPHGPLRVASPERAAVIAEAQLHATLALSAPEPAPVAVVQIPGVIPEGLATAIRDPAPTPRKRTAAKKAATPKETEK
jgi:hypothetical protein